MTLSNNAYQKLVEGIVKLDVLSDLGDIDRNLSPREIKLLWNFVKRFRYEERQIAFTDEEKKYFMSVSDYKGIPMPRFMTTFIELIAPKYLEISHESSDYPEVDFELYLINHIIYGKNLLFPNMTFMPETWEWLLTKVDFHVEGSILSLPKIACSKYYGNKKLREQFSLASKQGFLGFFGFFCLWGINGLVGYQPSEWMQAFMGAPSEIAGSEKLGITVLLEAIWYADRELQQWLNIHSENDQPKLVEWFINHKSKEIVGYRHPEWVVNLMGKHIDVVNNQQATAAAIPEQQYKRSLEEENNAETFFAAGGVNLVGWPRTAIGIGEDVRVAASSLEAVKIPFVVLDGVARVPPRPVQQNLGLEKHIVESPTYKTDVVFLDSATQFRYYSVDLIKNVKINRHIIVACPWELPTWPKEISFVFDHVTQFWAISKYIYDAFRPYFSEGKILLAPPAVYIPDEKIEPFSLLSMSEPFTFLTTFDGESSIQRKNPFAVVDAFQAAFSKSNRDVRLIIKTMNLRDNSHELNSLIEKINSDDRIELINQTLMPDELLALNRRAHCFVSLHRSEGFGRNIAENMLLGRPVICSAFSGNLDFCFEHNSYLVEGKLIPVNAGQYAFSRNQHWFDASVEHAALRMQEVYENRENAEKVAKAGRDYIKSFHSVAEAGKRYQKLLSNII